jgi:hypothetical protein
MIELRKLNNFHFWMIFEIHWYRTKNLVLRDPARKTDFIHLPHGFVIDYTFTPYGVNV